ncbi:hypothetical protein BJ170DRAFT_694610 [Xylariales sp. AK1849]|nr:hypothetical protein BJ170DRAFT_694610 [Xylariales sp. AK1849]
MQLTKALITFSLGTAAVSATSMNLFSGTQCLSSDYLKTLGDMSKGCSKLDGVKAVNFRTLGKGCNVHVYSDASCKKDKTPAGLDHCVAAGAGWKSYFLEC